MTHTPLGNTPCKQGRDQANDVTAFPIHTVIRHKNTSNPERKISTSRYLTMSYTSVPWSPALHDTNRIQQINTMVHALVWQGKQSNPYTHTSSSPSNKMAAKNSFAYRPKSSPFNPYLLQTPITNPTTSMQTFDMF